MPQCGFQFESGVIGAVGFGPTQKAAEQQASTIAVQVAHDAAKAWLKKQQPCPAACPIEQSGATSAGGSRIVVSIQVIPGLAFAVATHEWQAFIYCSKEGERPDISKFLIAAMKKKAVEESKRRAEELEKELKKKPKKSTPR